jgi:DNA-binding PadR family transcriptional regulator
MYSAYMSGKTPRRIVEEALPLRPRDFFVLVVLNAGDLHGYGIMKEVERESRGSVRLEVGSLYRTLDRLLEAGLIEEAEGGGAAVSSAGAERRRTYSLTTFGRQVAQAEAARLAGVVQLARAKGLLKGTGEVL